MIARQIIALLRMEWLRLLRTREALLFLILPSLLGVPALAAAATLMSTLIGRPDPVAVPLDIPAPLAAPLERALREQSLTPMPAADPGALLDAGRVKAAILGFQSGHGIEAARGDWEVATRWRWEVTARAPEALEGALKHAINAAGNEALEDWVAAGGADPEATLWFATVETARVKDAFERSPMRLDALPLPLISGYAVWMLAALSQYLMPVLYLTDRLRGVSESVFVTPTPAVVRVLTRLLVLTALQAAAGGVVALNCQLLLGQVFEIGWRVVPAVTLGLFCTALAANAALLLICQTARSVPEAGGRSSAFLLMLAMGMFLGWRSGQPGLPLIGVPAVTDAVGFVACLVSCLSTGALLAAIAARRSTGESALPPGGGSA